MILIDRKKTRTLDSLLQRIVLVRLLLPLMTLSTIAICGAGYLGKRTLENQLHTRVLYTARIIDRYLDQACRTLDVVAQAAAISNRNDLSVIMQSTWKAYGYFDTLYLLNSKSRITLLVPFNLHYNGLDMSNLPSFRQTGDKNKIMISRPFISLRTGNPTVYLIRELSRKGKVVGELSLESLQNEIRSGMNSTDHDIIFIMDQTGLLLAHPSFELVKQQTNQSSLEIFRRGLEKPVTLLYEYEDTMVLGSAERVERAGWIVVNQIPVSVSFYPYVLVLALTLLTFMVIWLALTWSLRRQLQRHVAIPLKQLSRGTGALANGDFEKGKSLVSLPDAFNELTSLIKDFQHMSDALETRQIALQESEERYRSLFHRVPVPLWRSTPEGHFLDINQACIHMLGGPDQETLLKVNTRDLYVNPEDRQQWQNIAKREKIVRDFEVQLRRYDGKIIWGRLTCLAVLDSAGNQISYEGSIEDITRHKLAEEEILQLNKELELRVAQRTAQLKAANKELKAFAYTVSHDLRAPLRHIEGFIKLLNKESRSRLNRQSLEYISVISDSTRKMGELINDLLSFSRVGRLEMKLDEVDLKALARDIIGELSIDINGRDIQWQIEGLSAVKGDASLLKIVMMNLFSNAVKFTRFKDRAIIEAGCKEGEEEITVFIRDNGVGFDQAYADKIFGVFQRLHRAEEFEGTGVGMAIVQRIIHRHGGRIWVEGEKDRGATFYFSLPKIQ